MIDYFTLALTHGLIAVALWRLLFRPELDSEEPQKVRRPWLRNAPEEGPNAAPKASGDA